MYAIRSYYEVKEERPLRLRRQGDHLAFGVGGGLLVDKLQIGRFATKTRAIIDNFAIDFAGSVVDERHGPVSLTEQVVYIVVGDFGKRAVDIAGFRNNFV